MIKSVYIHIPFCKDICSYCAFSKFYYNEEWALKYLDSLEKEIDLYYNREDIIETIYIGGGTPSSLSKEMLFKLFKIISKFNVSRVLEFTFECNFDISYEYLDILKENNVNRLSFGVETVNSKYYKDINRYNDVKNIINKINYAKKIGFNNINCDLMYGFKNQKINDLKKDIDFILSLDVSHISTYSLMVEENTKMFVSKYKSVSEDVDSSFYNYIHEILEKNGYLHYEVSNFSKVGYSSKHNLTYWKNLEYYGFGISASGYIDGVRYTNTKSFRKYINDFYRYSEEELDVNDKITYEVILGLRTKMGIDLDDFYNKYGVSFKDKYDISYELHEKYLEISGNYLYIPFDKWYVMNSILLKFVR